MLRLIFVLFLTKLVKITQMANIKSCKIGDFNI